MPRPSPRPVLAKAANAGAHPAAPPPIGPPGDHETQPHAAPYGEAPTEPADLVAGPKDPPTAPDAPAPVVPSEPVVMFSVRIPHNLRRAVKLAAVEQETTIEAWVESALRTALDK
jgi:hypothetical protein